MTTQRTATIPAALATGELQLSREQIVRRIQKGVLRGSFETGRGWCVERASVEEYKRRQQEGDRELVAQAS